MGKTIEMYREEIEQLQRDKMYVKNQVSVDAIQYQILIREASIKDIERENDDYTFYA